MYANARSWGSKVDHRLRALLARTQGHPADASRVVDVLLRFTGDVESLRTQGVVVRAVAGDIATASIALADIPTAASAPGVLYIELSRPLKPDYPERWPEGLT
jgi:hypothetical protein